VWSRLSEEALFSPLLCLSDGREQCILFEIFPLSRGSAVFSHSAIGPMSPIGHADLLFLLLIDSLRFWLMGADLKMEDEIFPIFSLSRLSLELPP